MSSHSDGFKTHVVSMVILVTCNFSFQLINSIEHTRTSTESILAYPLSSKWSGVVPTRSFEVFAASNLEITQSIDYEDFGCCLVC